MTNRELMQQLFDKSAFHLLTQGKKAQRKEKGTSSCRYRGPKGTSCAVGCLIPDELYTKVMEGGSWGSFQPPVDVRPDHPYTDKHNQVYALLNPNRSPDVDDLLQQLQYVHDRTPPREWASELRLLARSLRLNVSVIELAEVLTKDYGACITPHNVLS